MKQSILVALVVGHSVLLTGCQPKPEDETLLSWNAYVEDAKSGKAAYFQKLSAGMKEHGFSYEWESAEYYPRTKTGEIKVLVEPPEREPYTVGFQFALKDGQWEQTKAFDYSKNRVTSEEPEQSAEPNS